MTAFAVALTGPAPGAVAAPAGSPPQQQHSAPAAVGDHVANPDHDLPAGWRMSTDRAVTVAGDGSGLHVLVADSKDAYRWRAVATLSEDGVTDDQWVGNACMTASGTRAVVSYAPRGFTNDPDAFDRGTFAAIVDLTSGAVTKLPVTTTLAYFSPGCGAGESAVLTQENATRGQTRLITVDAAKGTVVNTVSVGGQATSAVPTADGTVAAIDSRLVSVDSAGHDHLLAATSGPAFDVHVDSAGGVAFVDRDGSSSSVHRVSAGVRTTLATGAVGSIGVSAGSGGRVFMTGKPVKINQLPATMSKLAVDPGAVVSSQGQLAVTAAAPASLADRLSQLGSVSSTSDSDPVSIGAVTANGTPVHFVVQPSPANGSTRSPALGAKAASAATSNDTVDGDRSCSIPRNDPNTQIYQPTPNQVEWAVDDAVRNDLTSTASVPIVRPAGWKNEGLEAWSPQDVFPALPLYGGNGQPLAGARVPAQVLLGIMAQESNLWQASGHVLPGQYGNPLVANFYGTTVSTLPGYQDSSWAIDWSKADCGYGVGQVTDGMRLPQFAKPGETPLSPTQQREVAVDYATNIAASLRILEGKWNELHQLPTPITINNDDPSLIENWFAALWDYNEGFNPQAGQNPWGLGWSNNPANPNYPANRHAFLDNNSYGDAAHPQDWPYEEKVLGWAAWPIDTGNSYNDSGVQDNGNTHGYQPAWWDSSADRSLVKPPVGAFCDTTNACDPTNPPHCSDKTCYTAHWFTHSSAWKSCPSQCGNEKMTYKTLRTEPGDATATKYPSIADCDTSKLPAGSVIIDTTDGGPVQSKCGAGSRSWTQGGSFSLSVNDDGTGEYRGREDLHQLSTGFGGHIWFAHTRSSTVGGGPGGNLTVTGTWTPNQLSGWNRVLVHVPGSASTTQQASYRINLGDGSYRTRVVNVHLSSDTWLSLGVFDFTANGVEEPSVVLSNTTDDGDGTSDIAWDAMAFQHLTAKPKDVVVQMGDSYSSGEGAEPYLPGTDVGPYASISSQSSPGESWNACRRSANSWIRQSVLPGDTGTVGALADGFDNNLDYHSTACSGAYVSNVDSGETGYGNIGQFHEINQLDSGWLDSDTTLVTLTVGGNDAGFSGAVQDCAQPGKSCPSDASVKDKINKLDADKGPLRTLLADIHNTAGKAKIVVLGYPELFGANIASTCTVMPNYAATQLNQWADYMATSQQQAVAAVAATGVPVTFYWPNNEFFRHRVCDGSGQGINDLVSAPTGPGDFSCPGNPVCPSMESYHPNNAGTKQYALAFQNALAAAKY
jgi:hypothetical protein